MNKSTALLEDVITPEIIDFNMQATTREEAVRHLGDAAPESRTD